MKLLVTHDDLELSLSLAIFRESANSNIRFLSLTARSTRHDNPPVRAKLLRKLGFMPPQCRPPSGIADSGRSCLENSSHFVEVLKGGCDQEVGSMDSSVYNQSPPLTFVKAPAPIPDGPEIVDVLSGCGEGRELNNFNSDKDCDKFGCGPHHDLPSPPICATQRAVGPLSSSPPPSLLSSSSSSSSNSSCSVYSLAPPSPPPKRRVSFSNSVSVLSVTPLPSYSPRILSSVYTTPSELQINALRNAREYHYEGWTFDGVIEEQGMVWWNGQWVHPAHFHPRATQTV